MMIFLKRQLPDDRMALTCMSVKRSPDTLHRGSRGVSDNTIDITSEKMHPGLTVFTGGLLACAKGQDWYRHEAKG